MQLNQQQHFIYSHPPITAMPRTIQENDIGALLSKMRDRQNNIKRSLDNDILRYPQQSNPYKVSSTSSSGSSSFENRLERIRGIRKKFEDQYSILRNSTNSISTSFQIPSKQIKPIQTPQCIESDDSIDTDVDSLTLPLHKLNNSENTSNALQRPLSAQRHSDLNKSNALKHSVSVSNINKNISYPLTSRDDIHSINVDKENQTKQIEAKPKIPRVQKQCQKQHKTKQKQSKLVVKRGKNLGNLPENIYFDIFCNLDSITLAQMSNVCDSWYHTIRQSVRFMFSIPFKSYPLPKKLPSKTIFFTLKKLHFIDSKSCAELLFWSCARGYSAFLQHFVANLNKSNDIELRLPTIRYSLNAISKIDAMTALHIASKHNQYDIVRMLLSHKQTDINKLTKSGKHALIIAAQRGNHRIVDLLISDSKMNVNQIDNDAKSLLYIACSMGNVYAVNQLLNKGANPNVIDKENRTPLYIVSENGYLDICRCLLRKNEEFEKRDFKKENEECPVDILLASKSGKSPLYAASENGHVDIVSYLLKKGANVRQETCRGKIPLYAAAEKQFVQIVRAILPYTKEQDLFKLTHYGTTAMFIASKQSNKTVKKMLVSFCTKQKRNNQIVEEYDAKNEHDEVVMIENALPNEWRINNDIHERLGTPKFAEQFESFQEKQKRQNKKRNGFNSMNTPFSMATNN